MQTQKKNQNNIFTDQQLISYCPSCRRPFTSHEAIVISQALATQLLHLTCSNCTSSIVLLLIVNESGMGSVGVITDMTEKDTQKFATADRVTFDDCLYLYQLLTSQGWKLFEN